MWRPTLVILAVMFILLSPKAWGLTVGYYGSDGGCSGPPYARVFAAPDALATVLLSKTDGCYCGCDSLAWLGLAELDKGLYLVFVEYTLAEHRGSPGKLKVPSVAVVEEWALWSTGYTGAARYRGPIIAVDPTWAIWDRPNPVAAVTVYHSGDRFTLVYPFDPLESIGVLVRVKLIVRVDGDASGHYTVRLVASSVEVGGVRVSASPWTHLADVMAEYRGKPWIALYARTGWAHGFGDFWGPVERQRIVVWRYTVTRLPLLSPLR